LPDCKGNDKQLKMMRRRYKRELYADRVAYIKQRMPHCCIGVDVIVGFPGETEEDFLESYRFINELDISYLHVFTYSERPNTPANEMEGVVPVHERRRRNEMLRILSEKKRRHFYSQFIGQNRKVLFEKSKAPGRMTGFTDNYVKVDLPLDESLINAIAPVRLQAINPEGLVAAVLAPASIDAV
ncbi:MAG: tRNA (N(6)-L-threonylcarbamoyladenosine(37)-C(2))-methylthiotransferase MtaB, partial [Bacteroidota bacterium]